MLIEVAEFCRRTAIDLEELVEELQDHTGREGDSEAYAWRSSLPVLAKALGSDRLGRLHLYFERQGRMEIEYRLPASGSWCDAVLLGQGPRGPAAVITELKHWVTGDDRPGPNESLVTHAGNLVSHPSVQVGSYVEYCRRFHSAVQQHDAAVHGCVLFTRTTQLSPYLQPPHAELVGRFPVFGCSDGDLVERLPRWITEYLVEPNERFATEFSEGQYQQDRRFVRHVSSLLQDPRTSPFVLLDQQRQAYDLILHEIEKHAAMAAQGKRLVVLVEGPPGSGKSVLAAQLWAKMAVHPTVEGNVVLCTTSGCQRSVWEHMFESVADSTAGRGLVVPANAFNPGMSGNWVTQQRVTGEPMLVADWRRNLALFEDSGKKSRTPDLHFATTIVDEAHALVDPTTPNTEGVFNAGWCMQAGPQVWHIVRASRVSVLLMDSEQSYRDNETTTPEQVELHSLSFSEARVVRISLHGAQFRCGGSKEYTDWVEDVLETSSPESVALDWRRWSGNVAGKFEFDLLSSPLAVERALRSRHEHGDTVRLVAPYARKWVTKDQADPHSLPDHDKDFHITVESRNGPVKWSKIWNHAPEGDYTFFVLGRAGTAIARDPLCEVGCPYVVRGFDYDYVGLLWLSDFVRRGNTWIVQPKHVHEIAWRKTLAAVKNGDAKAKQILLRRCQRAYRILLTRAIKGMYVWCEDDETREYLRSRLTQG